MKKICCYVSGFEPYGIFAGVLLAKSNANISLKYRRSTEFYNLVSFELENFLEIYDYNLENIEKYFSWYVISYKSKLKIFQQFSLEI